MSTIILKKQRLRKGLVHYNVSKEGGGEANCILDYIYDDHAPSDTACKERFRLIQGGDDFHEWVVKSNEEREGAQKQFEGT